MTVAMKGEAKEDGVGKRGGVGAQDWGLGCFQIEDGGLKHLRGRQGLRARVGEVAGHRGP